MRALGTVARMPIPDFVSDLRARIGTDLLWLPGVSGVVVDEDGRLLLGRRSDTGAWAVVSGILEPGEEPGVAIVREILEETGVHAEVVALTAVSVSEHVTYPNGDEAQYLDVCFWCRPVGGDAHVADDESLEVGWFAPDALPAPLTPSSRDRIDRTLAFVRATAAAATTTGAAPGPWFAR